VHRSLEELSNRRDFLSHDPVLVKIALDDAPGADPRTLARPPCGGQAVQGDREAHSGNALLYRPAAVVVRIASPPMASRQCSNTYAPLSMRTVYQLSLYRDMMFSSLGCPVPLNPTGKGWFFPRYIHQDHHGNSRSSKRSGDP